MSIAHSLYYFSLTAPKGVTVRMGTVAGWVAVGALLVGVTRALPQDCTIVVQPGDSIQAAINAASEGGVICLADGEWREDLTITKSLTLRGSGIDRTTLRGWLEGWWPVIEIRHSKEIRVTIEEIAIVEGNNGIWARGLSRVQLSNVAINGHRQNGIAIWELAEVVIVGSTVGMNRYDGVTISDSGRVSIVDSTIRQNGGLGIEARGSAQVRLSRSTITDNGEYGLFLQGGSATTITQCLIRSAVLGVAISGAARAAITGSTVEGGEYGGVYLEGTAQATITGSTIAGGESFYGVTVVGSAQVSITRSIVAHQWLYGISAWDSATVSITNSDVYENTWGIVLAGSAHATIVGNRISGNRQYGVAIFEAPCFKTDKTFTGYVSGRSNVVPGPLEIGGNQRGAFCSALLFELGFLTTAKGGVLDAR